MSMNRMPRRLAHLMSCLLFALAAAVFSKAAAQDYPDRPITIVIPGAAGGGIDLTFRLLEPKLTELLGQKVVIENRPGASGNTGSASVARATPDGYTLLAMAATQAVNPAIMEVSYSLTEDLAPISLVVKTPSLLVSHPKVPANNLSELIAYAKNNPGKLTFGSAGIGSMPHLQMELFLNQASIEFVHVPYASNGQAINDVLAGHVDFLILNTLTALPHVKADRLRAYGTTSRERVSTAPDIPTLDEAGVAGYEAIQWFGLMAPAGTPDHIITKLHRAVTDALSSPEISNKFQSDGVIPSPSATPDEFGAFVKSEMEKWANVIKTSKIEMK